MQRATRHLTYVPNRPNARRALKTGRRAQSSARLCSSNSKRARRALQRAKRPAPEQQNYFLFALEAVSLTLYFSRLRKHKNTYKNTTKLSNGIKVYENTSIRKVNVITQKRGIIQTVLTKSIDKCHYLHTQNNYNLALNNSPQLESVCPQTGPNIQRIKSKNPKNQESTRFGKTKQLYGSNKNT